MSLRNRSSHGTADYVRPNADSEVQESSSAPLGGLRRILRFGLVGGICATTNLIFLWWAIEIAGVNYLVACTISFFLINLFGYFLNRRFTFGVPWPATLAEAARHYGVMAFSLALNLLAMWLLVAKAGLDILVSSVSVTVLLTLLNYAAHVRITYSALRNK
jgi:putative flippase GtrA